ncbi:hypothetical protein SpCBS45565_g08430 [Spizellomyces sp. 'palustris']|nr:hypothetical protein SpCBS45565_g08430 [Spizellomyces sp. 'palustris']
MSEFGDFVATDGSNPANASAFLTSDDPAADFLAREQAILGADAALFGNDLAAATPAPAASEAGFGAFGDAPDSSFVLPNGSEVEFANESGFGDTPFAGDAAPLPFEHTGASSVASFGSVPLQSREPEPEPEIVRQWREDFNARVAERDARSKAKHTETLNAAKESLERFYAEYNDKKTKSINRNKEQEKNTIAERDDTTSGTVWDRVVKQIEMTAQASSASSSKGKVDLKPGRLADEKSKDAKTAKPVMKTRDTARMKQLLMSLRKDSKAPGVETAA